MVVVDDFDKWLDFSSLGDLLSTQVLGDFQWASFNTNNNGVREWMGFGTFIVWFHNDNLLTSKSTSDNNSYIVSNGSLNFNITPTRIGRRRQTSSIIRAFLGFFHEWSLFPQLLLHTNFTRFNEFSHLYLIV